MCVCVSMWMNELYRGADEAHTFKRQTKLERWLESGAVRTFRVNQKKKKSLFCYGVWSAGGPHSMGDTGGEGRCVFVRASQR